MIRVKNIELESNNVLKFLQELKLKQKEISEDEVTVYPKIALYTALKHKIFFSNLLLHPKILTKKKFFKDKEQISDDKSLKEELGKVLQYEMTSDEKLSIDERTKVIKVFNKLQRKVGTDI